MSLPTGTVTLLFTDIEGSTRLLEELGAARYADALEEHRRLLRAAFAERSGVEVDTEGDAFFVAFERATDAVAAAAAAQRSLETGPIRIRVGLHTGEPLVHGDDYIGMDVHRAARIMAAGHGGQTLLSDTTARLTDGATLQDLGEHRLKDLSAPQRLYQLGDGAFPPLKTLYRTNLPVQPTPLVGRKRELGEAGALLREHRLLTLTGAGGSGKTRLALQLAADASEAFPDGVCWVPLAPLEDPELVLAAVAGALELRETGAGSLAETIAAYIGDKHLLLLLDNFEHLLVAAPQLAGLLSSCPRAQLLVTSRAVLRLAQEQEFEVPPLDEADAVALFVQRARTIRAETPMNGATTEICRRLDGLPLAVELAAARLRLLDPDDLLVRLERRLPLLTGGARDAPARQRTLRATIEWSHDLLTSEEQRLLARLSVFAGSFTAAAAEEVCEADLDTLESLVEHSLVRRWGTGRLGMLETIREYALERLGEAGEEQEYRTGHREHFFALVSSLEPKLKSHGQLGAYARLDAEHENVRAALRNALDEGRADSALEACSALMEYWDVRSHFSEARRWVGEGLASEHVAPRARALGLRALQLFAVRVGEYEQSLAAGREAAALFEELGDEARLAHCLAHAAWASMVRGDEEESVQLAERAVALARDAGDVWILASTLNSLGLAVSQVGERERARRLLEESARLCTELGDERYAFIAICNLAEGALEDGDYERALELNLRCAAVADRLGDRAFQANARLSAAAVFVMLGRLDEAEAALAEALASVLELNAKSELAECAFLAAVIAARRSEAARAVRLWAASEAMRRPSGYALSPGIRPAQPLWLEPLRTELGDEFAELWAAGEVLTPELAVDLATRAPAASPAE